MDPTTTSPQTAETNAAGGKKKTPQNQTPTKQQLKGKRKDLPAATRNMLDGERSKMIELYRQLKKGQQSGVTRQ